MNIKRICSRLLLICLAVAVLYKLAFWVTHPMITWADQSVYLGMAQLLLRGKIPYVDFFDFNLPLIIYLNAIPVALANIFGQPPPLMLDICVLILLTGILFLCDRILALSPNRVDYYTKLPWLSALVLFTQIQNSDFAQREHIFVLLTAPFLLLRGLHFECAAASAQTKNKSKLRLFYLVGALAALGANIKPHFLVIIATFEILASLDDINKFSLAAIKERFLRPEIKAFAIATAIYCLHFIFYPAEAWRVFLQEALPVYLNGSVWFSQTVIASLAGDEDHYVPIYSLVIITLLVLPIIGRSRLIVPLLGYSYSALIIYMLTGGTWVYRLLPVQAGVIFIGAVVLGMSLATIRAKFLKNWPYLRLAATAGLVITTGYMTITNGQAYFYYFTCLPKVSLRACGYNWKCPESDFSALYYSILKHSEIGDYVIYMGTGVRPGYPATLQANRRPGSRYLHGMIVPMAQVCANLKKGTFYNGTFYSDLLTKIMNDYGDDIKRNQPKLVYWQNGLTTDFEAEAFCQKFLSSYRNIGTLNSMGCTVYKRLGASMPRTGDKNTDQSAQKKELLLKVLLKEITAEECAQELLVTPKEIEDQAKRLSNFVDDTLSGDAGGGDEEWRAKLKTAIEEKAILQKSIDKLLDDNIKLHKAIHTK